MRMKKMIPALGVLVFALCGTLRAEVLKGPAGLRFEAKGRAVVSLNDGVQVECVESTEPWKQAGFTAYVEAAYLEQAELKIKKGAVLYDKAGKVFGRVTEPFPLEFTPGKPDARTGRAMVEIVLLAYYQDIKQDSIIENALARELKGAMGMLAPGGLAAHLKKFGYRKWYGYEGVESSGVYENWIEDPSPGFRVLLIFHRGKLAAVLHSRSINYKFIASKDFMRGCRLSYIRKLPEPETRTLEKFYTDMISKAD